MATLLVNSHTQSNSKHTNQSDLILYTQQVENELKHSKIQNEELKQQITDCQTHNALKDQELEVKTTENTLLKHEIQQLKNEIYRLSQQNPKQNALKLIDEPSLSVNTVTMSVISENTNNIDTNHSDKIFEGYIHKKENKFNKPEIFEKRYFILYSNNILSYYASNDVKDEELMCLGDINLYTIVDIQKEQSLLTFHLLTPKRRFTLQCETHSQFEKWTQIIALRVFPKQICQGWLYKKGEKHKLWKLRYCVLCELIGNDLYKHYQCRYYEDEQCKKYKGNINCDKIKEISIVNSHKKYGKHFVLELVTDMRVYVLSFKDIHSRDLWHKSLQIVFDTNAPHIPKPHISVSESVNAQSVSLPQSSEKPSFIRILEPISEKHTKQFQPSPVSPMLVQASDNNENIANNEWNDCFAALSTSPSLSSNAMNKQISNDRMDRLQIEVFSDEEPSISNISSADTERLMANNMRALSVMSAMTSMNRTVSGQSNVSNVSLNSIEESIHQNNTRMRGNISYMSGNSLMLLDMNDEIYKLGQIIDNKLGDVMDCDDSLMELSSVKSHTQVFTEMSFDNANGCDDVIHSPFTLYTPISVSSDSSQMVPLTSKN